jgi:hypothetical protein
MQRLLAVLFTAAPFVAGAIAALGVRHDLRMLWMALAATVVARVVEAMARGRRGSAFVSAMAFASAVVAASIVALAFGAHAVFGIVAVAVVLSGCATAGVVLGRPPQPTNP